jgi:uncharacterized membrane protein YkvA (DUF1232 family)
VLRSATPDSRYRIGWRDCHHPWMVVRILIALVAGLLVLWAGLIIALRVVAPEQARLKDVMRLLPDLLRLLSRLARDPTLPRGVRVRLGLLLAYLALPIDLVPDFIPVVGYADDAIIIALTLRSVIRRSGSEAVRRHWPGTEEGLATVLRISGAPEESSRPRSSRPSVGADGSPVEDDDGHDGDVEAQTDHRHPPMRVVPVRPYVAGERREDLDQDR